MAIVTLLFLPLAFVCAQDIGHYKNIADTTSNDLIKLEAIDSLLKKSFQSDQDTFITYSYIYIDLAKKIDSFEFAARKAMNLQYPLTAYKNNPQKAIMVINGVLAHKYKIKDSILLGG